MIEVNKSEFDKKVNDKLREIKSLSLKVRDEDDYAKRSFLSKLDSVGYYFEYGN